MNKTSFFAVMCAAAFMTACGDTRDIPDSADIARTAFSATCAEAADQCQKEGERVRREARCGRRDTACQVAAAAAAAAAATACRESLTITDCESIECNECTAAGVCKPLCAGQCETCDVGLCVAATSNPPDQCMFEVGCDPVSGFIYDEKECTAIDACHQAGCDRSTGECAQELIKDLDNDAANCGECGHACESGERCVEGSCACPAATPDSCNGECYAQCDTAAGQARNPLTCACECPSSTDANGTVHQSVYCDYPISGVGCVKQCLYNTNDECPNVAGIAPC